jgi:maleylpyruvate isomerase
MSPVPADLPSGAVGSLLTALDVATDDLSASLARASAFELGEPSLLEGWSRAHVVAHLANVAAALVRMTHDALADRSTSMYPDGRALRDAEIESVAAQPWEDLHAWFVQSTGALTNTWHSVPWERWGQPFTESELGSMQFGRLVGLRLTEVEVHHADLAVGFGPREWSPALTRTCLPLRVASLGRLRRRPDADHTINGSWVLECDELDQRWSVHANHGEVRIDEIEQSDHDRPTADVVLRGSALDLTAVLLGRQDPAMLAVSGDTARAGAFKRAFPGP